MNEKVKQCLMDFLTISLFALRRWVYIMFRKKYLALILALVLALLPFQAYSSNLKSIMLQINSSTAYVNMEPVPLDAAPMISNGRTMVPLRFIAEHFGARDITFQAETKVVVWTSGAIRMKELLESVEGERFHA